MKKLDLIIFYLFIFCIPLSAQSITFNRALPPFEEGFNYGVSSLPAIDGGYIVCGIKQLSYSTNLNLIIYKIDANGFLKWYSIIQSDSSILTPVNPVIETSSRSIIVVGTKGNGGKKSMFTTKLNSRGSLVWEKTFPSQVDIYGSSVLETEDNKYLLLGGSKENLQLIKTDTLGNVLWVKDFDIPFTIGTQILNLAKWGDGYAIGDNKEIIKVNSSGTEEFRKSISARTIHSLNNGSILAAEGKGFYLIDRNGNIVSTKSFDNFIYAISAVPALNDNSFLLLFKSSDLLKTDTHGNIIWYKVLRGSFTSLTSTPDNGILLTGLNEYWNLGNFIEELKTDSSGDYNSINLYSLADKDTLSMLDCCTLKWRSKGVHSVDINYSTDGGNLWQNIVSNFPSDSGNYYWNDPFYNWFVPDIPTSNLIVRVSSSTNHLVYDQNCIPISVTFSSPFPDYDTFTANEIKMWIGNNGLSSYDPNTQGQGLFWPGGENATKGAVFEDGLVWAGKVNGEIRAGGSTYNHGLTAGRILPDGMPSSRTNINSKIFKIKKDWKSLPVSSDKFKFKFDYENWPSEIGAPWFDINKDGIYTEGIDEPMYIGDETMWFVSNDLDTSACHHLYGTDPLGLEIQTTIFGYNSDNLENAVFKKYVLINKGQNTIDSMYLAYWTDDDLGDANDDFIGCDSSLRIGFTYNAVNNDAIYGIPPPAVGHLIVQSPIVVSSENDSARFDNSWRKGYRNLPATAFILYLSASSIYMDAPFDNSDGAKYIYNNMKGFLWNGSPLINPKTNHATKFMLNGDPVSNTGWYEGTGWPGGPGPGDRRFLISSGPFTLAPGDTQEVVFAVLLAKGNDNLNSVTKLKQSASYFQNFYNSNLIDTLNSSPYYVAPEGYRLFQNYPNPFNAVTNLEYELPKTSDVEIKIYDILGRLVKTIVNEKAQVRYIYKVLFDAKNLASGIYFYRIRAGNFVETKKMILLK